MCWGARLIPSVKTPSKCLRGAAQSQPENPAKGNFSKVDYRPEGIEVRLFTIHCDRSGEQNLGIVEK